MREGLAGHVSHVYRLALRLTGDQHRAEDLTQETFLRAWKRREQLKEGRAERVWLFRIAANLWRDELRRSGGLIGDNLFPLPDDACDSHPSPDHAVAVGEDVAHALEMLNGLPVRQRTVLYLVAVEALSLDEVSAILGTNTNAVKVNLSLARKAMRDRTAKLSLNVDSRSETSNRDE